jgi:hypothetical protein
MVRVKNTAKVLQKHAALAKRAKKVMANAKGLVHTGKLKVPFKPAAKSLASAKKGLVKQLKRR